MSISYLARETGLSPTTIRYLGSPTRRHNKSTLVALSAVLGWRYMHLVNILDGAPENNITKPADSPLEAYYENLLIAEVAPMRDQMAELVTVIDVIGRKIDVIFGERQSDPAGEPDAGGPA